MGSTLDGRHSVLDKGFQLLGIFLYLGQHNQIMGCGLGVVKLCDPCFEESAYVP